MLSDKLKTSSICYPCTLCDAACSFSSIQLCVLLPDWRKIEHYDWMIARYFVFRTAWSDLPRLPCSKHPSSISASTSLFHSYNTAGHRKQLCISQKAYLASSRGPRLGRHSGQVHVHLLGWVPIGFCSFLAFLAGIVLWLPAGSYLSALVAVVSRSVLYSVSTWLFTGIFLLFYQQRSCSITLFLAAWVAFLNTPLVVPCKVPARVSICIFPKAGKVTWKMKDAICVGSWNLLPPIWLWCMEVHKLGSSYPGAIQPSFPPGKKRGYFGAQQQEAECKKMIGELRSAS